MKSKQEANKGPILTAEPGTLEFLEQLLAIAKTSNHPNDRALVGVLERRIAEWKEEEAYET